MTAATATSPSTITNNFITRPVASIGRFRVTPLHGALVVAVIAVAVVIIQQIRSYVASQNKKITDLQQQLTDATNRHAEAEPELEDKKTRRPAAAADEEGSGSADAQEMREIIEKGIKAAQHKHEAQIAALKEQHAAQIAAMETSNTSTVDYVKFCAQNCKPELLEIFRLLNSVKHDVERDSIYFHLSNRKDRDRLFNLIQSVLIADHECAKDLKTLVVKSTRTDSIRINKKVLKSLKSWFFLPMNRLRVLPFIKEVLKRVPQRDDAAGGGGGDGQ
ncbi:hypothetical protein K0U07_05935 [bacterium]|nr:hypothetical protein [bacterium]